MNPGHFGYGPEEVASYLADIGKRGGTTEHAWSEATTKRVAVGLLTIAADFGLLRGSVVKEFASYHLPERSFLYLLYALEEEKQSPGKVIAAPDWRMFLMRPRTSSTSFFACTSFASSTTRSPAASCS